MEARLYILFETHERGQQLMHRCCLVSEVLYRRHEVSTLNAAPCGGDSAEQLATQQNAVSTILAYYGT